VGEPVPHEVDARPPPTPGAGRARAPRRAGRERPRRVHSRRSAPPRRRDPRGRARPAPASQRRRRGQVGRPPAVAVARGELPVPSCGEIDAALAEAADCGTTTSAKRRSVSSCAGVSARGR
jgi:hypothetical protein